MVKFLRASQKCNFLANYFKILMVSAKRVTRLLEIHETQSTKPIKIFYFTIYQNYWLRSIINPFSTGPDQNVVWYTNSWLGFLKILNYVPNERENFSAKTEPSFVTVNVVMAHRNYFRRNYLWILKLATYTKIEDHYSRCKLATF